MRKLGRMILLRKRRSVGRLLKRGVRDGGGGISMTVFEIISDSRLAE